MTFQIVEILYPANPADVAVYEIVKYLKIMIKLKR